MYFTYAELSRTKIQELANSIAGKQQKEAASVVCGCGLCAGGVMRDDIEHYKLATLTEPQRELYMSLDRSTNTIVITEKH